MKCLFARHGESQANLEHVISNRDLPHGLTSTGRRQAAELGDQLVGASISHIYTSPVPRALETAGIVARRLKLDISVEDGLREYDCGILEGRSDEAAWQMWQENHAAWVIEHRYSQHIPGGESYWEVQKRFVAFIQRLIERHSGSQEGLLCISHGGVYGLMLPVVLPNVTYEMAQTYGFPYTGVIVAELQPEGLLCVEWNGIPVQSNLSTLDRYGLE